MRIPSMLLRQLYTFGSLANTDGGVRFSLKNRLTDVVLTRFLDVSIDGTPVSVDSLTLDLGDGKPRRATEVSPDAPAKFPVRTAVDIRAPHAPLADGEHEIRVRFEAAPFGTLEIKATDAVGLAPAAPREGNGAAAATTAAAPESPAPTAPADTGSQHVHIPFDHDDTRNYTPEMVAARRAAIEKATGVTFEHLSKYSFDPARAKGHAENFVGVAQVPLGFAGPVLINGEYARGEFYVPLATSEGSLVASYSRGMKVLTLSGGVTVTVCDDQMQRAPVFVFPSARDARDFRAWVVAHMDEIRTQAESTSHVAKLIGIETYLASKMAFLRFDFETGDAAGQNMVTKATYVACSWILENAPKIERYYLESNLATDKKPSHVNMMHTRGKRVTAEATIPADVLMRHLHVEPESLRYHNEVANVGAFLSGVNNNGLHSVNGITALFIATGQDVANVAEATSLIGYTELLPNRALYMSVTIPSLIVATHGGGTGLPTQHECLAALGCTERGSARKLAEIAGATVLAGEISLACAISSLEWVTAHERYGRHR